MSSVVGIDRSAGRWVVVELARDSLEVSVVASCAGIEADVVAIDIPLGFPDPGSRRQAEVEGRRLLGPRASTLFFTPPREALELPWAEARRMGVSKQAWNLGKAILDAMAAAGRNWHEVHPELVFAHLAGAPLPPKKTAAGSDVRRGLLADHGIDVAPIVGVPMDDLVDAVACALTARRILDGEAHSLGGDDGAGSIWY